MFNVDGDIIISEEEFTEIKRLQDLKLSYRKDFDELKQLKSEVHYCEKLVDQCRQRLIQGTKPRMSLLLELLLLLLKT